MASTDTQQQLSKPPLIIPGIITLEQLIEGVKVIDAWRPTNPKITNGSDNRSAKAYRIVLDQFGVEVNPRYKPRNNNTFCNIALWDMSRAMCAEIPHWVSQEGKPSPMGAGHELNANAVARWLLLQGPQFGWQPCNMADASAHAAIGQPAAVAWDAGDGFTGHVAMVAPGSSQSGCRITQAGGTNYNDADIVMGFGQKRLSLVRFYWHA